MFCQNFHLRVFSILRALMLFLFVLGRKGVESSSEVCVSLKILSRNKIGSCVVVWCIIGVVLGVIMHSFMVLIAIYHFTRFLFALLCVDAFFLKIKQERYDLALERQKRLLSASKELQLPGNPLDQVSTGAVQGQLNPWVKRKSP